MENNQFDVIGSDAESITIETAKLYRVIFHGDDNQQPYELLDAPEAIMQANIWNSHHRNEKRWAEPISYKASAERDAAEEYDRDVEKAAKRLSDKRPKRRKRSA